MHSLELHQTTNHANRIGQTSDSNVWHCTCHLRSHSANNGSTMPSSFTMAMHRPRKMATALIAAFQSRAKQQRDKGAECNAKLQYSGAWGCHCFTAKTFWTGGRIKEVRICSRGKAQKSVPTVPGTRPQSIKSLRRPFSVHLLLPERVFCY